MSPQAPSEERSFPTPGFRWNSRYQVVSAMPGDHGSQAWEAIDLQGDHPVCLQVSRMQGAAHDEALRRILADHVPGLRLPFSSALAEAATIDILPSSAGIALPEWRKQNPEPSQHFIQALLGFLSPILGGLHAKGVGHFNLRPEAIHVSGEAEQPVFTLGCWDCCTLLEQKDLISIPVDPYYAPPEAAGLTRHQPGPELACWDWWALGRVLQELVLGQPVLGLLLSVPVSHDRSAYSSKAEELLLSRLGVWKPGGVEAMSAVAPRTQLLLRGLLASSRDARWRGEECDAWSKGETPLEHYAVAGREPCLRWDGQAHTAAELASALRTEEAWEHAAEQLFSVTAPGTLGWFVEQKGSDDLRARLTLASGLLKEESLQTLPTEAVRDVATALGLMLLAGGKLTWRGRVMDAACLHDLLYREDGSGRRLGSALVLTAVPVLCILDKYDSESGRIMTDIGHLAGKAVETAILGGWLLPGDTPGIARIWELSCQSHAFLASRLSEFRHAYACSLDESVQALFGNPVPSASEQVVLCFMACDPRRFSFLTRSEWAKREYQRLHDSGQRAARGLFWMNLRSALKPGLWWYGKPWWPLLGWGSAGAAFESARPGPLMLLPALSPLLFALGLRWFLRLHLRPQLARWAPGARAWSLLDTQARCLAETRALGVADQPRSDLRMEVSKTNEAISSLEDLAPPGVPVPLPPRFHLIFLSSLLSWPLLACTLTLVSWQVRVHPPSWEGFRQAWGLAKTSEDRRDFSEVKMPWPFKQPEKMLAIPAHGYRPTTPADIAAGLAKGAQQVRDYDPKTIDANTLVRIPSESAFAFLLYDGKRHQIVSREVIILVYNPLPREWIQIDGKPAFILPE